MVVIPGPPYEVSNLRIQIYIFHPIKPNQEQPALSIDYQFLSKLSSAHPAVGGDVVVAAGHRHQQHVLALQVAVAVQHPPHLPHPND